MGRPSLRPTHTSSEGSRRTFPLLVLTLSLLCAALLSATAAAAPKRADTDRDGLSNRKELRIGTSPRRSDTDRDRLSDGREVRRLRTNPLRRDTDREGLTDGREVSKTRTNPRLRDTDGDGLSDFHEVRRSHTDPLRADTDADGFGDGYEVNTTDTDPLRADSDGDGVGDLLELAQLQNPLDRRDKPPPGLDLTPPETTIVSGPTGIVSSTSASFSFSSSESRSTFECRLDAGAWTACSSPAGYSNLTAGAHTFEVRARDRAGNTDPSPASHSWTIAEADTSAPDTTITSGPSGTVSTGDASFGFGATETGSTFECRLDAAAWAGCSSPKTYTGLAAGSHTFEVRAKDAAGNVDPTPASRSWTIEAAAQPVARYTYSPTSPQTGQEVTFDGSGSSCSATPCSYRWEDDGPDGAGGTQWPLGSGQVLRFTFTEPGTIHARLTVTDAQGRSDSTVKTFTVADAPAPPPPPPPPARCADGIDNDGDSKVDYPGDPGCTDAGDDDETDPSSPPPTGLPPLGQPSCVDGATDVTTATALRAEVAAGRNACVTAAVGNVDLSSLPSATVRHVGTSTSGSIGHIRIDGSSRITFRARFRSTKITNSNNLTIEQSRVGGTSTARTLDMLIFIAEPADDITIRDNDIGWTTADNTGNTGFGIRAYNDSDNLRVERNYIHHIGADAMQFGLSGDNLLIDRNEVAYAARPPESNEHSDDLQIMGSGANARVTNNYFHHCGWFTASGPTTGCNALAIHAGWDGIRYENNYQGDALGIPDLGDLGTGGCTRSNAVWRRNTWIRNGTQFSSGLDVNYAHCGGSNNLWERNLVVETFGNKYGFAASGTTARDNLNGTYTLDSSGNCTAAACNPSGQEPIGYRKPTGVHW